MPRLLSPAEVRAILRKRSTIPTKRVGSLKSPGVDTTLLNAAIPEDENESTKKTASDIADDVLIKLAQGITPEELAQLRKQVAQQMTVPTTNTVPTSSVPNNDEVSPNARTEPAGAEDSIPSSPAAGQPAEDTSAPVPQEMDVEAPELTVPTPTGGYFGVNSEGLSPKDIIRGARILRRFTL